MIPHPDTILLEGDRLYFSGDAAGIQAVKDALATKGVAGERLFLTAPKVGAAGATAAALCTEFSRQRGLR